MLTRSVNFCIALFVILAALPVFAQFVVPVSGEITVRLTEGMDSLTDPKAISHGQVLSSTNPAVPKGSIVLVGLGSDPIKGGYTAKLLQITLAGKTMPAASSAVALKPDLLGKAYEFTRDKGQPKDAVSGTRVFLPTQTIVRFTLTTPPPPAISKPKPAEETTVLPIATEWKFKTINEDSNPGHEAYIPGTVEINGKRAAAQLAVQCTIRHFSNTPYPDATLEYALRMRGSMLTFPTDSLGCMGDGAGNDFARFKFGDKPESKVEFCYDGDPPQNPAQVVTAMLHPVDLQSVIKAPGSGLQIMLRLPDTQVDALKATFQLPADAGALSAMTDACVDVLHQTEARIKAAIVVSCPEVPGKILRTIDVLIGSAMKPLPNDPEDTINVSWNLPKKTKAHPILPKETLACSYGIGPDATPKEVLVKKLLPIPPSAAVCVLEANEGHCSKADATQ